MLKLEPSTKPQRIVVFDLDETLGSFLEIGIFWDALEHYYGHSLFKERLFEVLDLFEEFLRPNILNILEFVNHLKDIYQVFILLSRVNLLNLIRGRRNFILVIE